MWQAIKKGTHLKSEIPTSRRSIIAIAVSKNDLVILLVLEQILYYRLCGIE